MKLLGDRLLVLPVEDKAVTSGGLIIPDVAKEKPKRGKVTHVGVGIKGKEMSVKVGDEVLYGQYSGIEYVFDNKVCHILREAEVQAIL